MPEHDIFLQVQSTFKHYHQTFRKMKYYNYYIVRFAESTFLATCAQQEKKVNQIKFGWWKRLCILPHKTIENSSFVAVELTLPCHSIPRSSSRRTNAFQDISSSLIKIMCHIHGSTTVMLFRRQTKLCICTTRRALHTHTHTNDMRNFFN